MLLFQTRFSKVNAEGKYPLKKFMKKNFSLILFLVILFQYSCRKKPDAVPVVPASEFINLTLNGVNYSWASTDSLYGARVNSGNGQFYTKILGATHWNITPLKLIDLNFGNGTVAIGAYPSNVSISINTIIASYVTSGNTATANVTEYGTVGNYIGGTAAGQIMQLSSGTFFTFSCSYRVKRII